MMCLYEVGLIRFVLKIWKVPKTQLFFEKRKRWNASYVTTKPTMLEIQVVLWVDITLTLLSWPKCTLLTHSAIVMTNNDLLQPSQIDRFYFEKINLKENTFSQSSWWYYFEFRNASWNSDLWEGRWNVVNEFWNLLYHIEYSSIGKRVCFVF